MLTIRYEDFLAHEEATLKRVCAFFGIDFLPQMLDVSRSAEAQQISQMSALWLSNCFPPIMANADKFKQKLSLADIEIIETLARDFMDRYGYALMTDANAPRGALVQASAVQRSDAGRKLAWRELETANFRDFTLRRHRADYLAAVRKRLDQQQAIAPATLPEHSLA